MQPQGPNTEAIRRQNKAIMRRMLACFNNADAEAVEGLCAPDVFENIPIPPEAHGLAGLKQQIRDLHAAFADLQFEETSCIAEGDIVVLRHRLTGVHRAPFLGVPATNKKISYPGQEIVRIKDGKIVEHLGAYDVLEFLDALGMLDAQLLEHRGLRRLRAFIVSRLLNPQVTPTEQRRAAAERAGHTEGEAAQADLIEV